MKQGSRKFTAIDLFSGCGGLTKGLKNAGFAVLGAVEIDALSAETYRHNHRNTRIWETDIRLLNPLQLRRDLGLKRGELDLLAGCPPCQGFSTIRTRNGAKQNRDLRNTLVHEMLRFIRSFHPKTVMMENVPGLKTRSSFRDLCRGLRELGYMVSWQIKDAANYGVPQRRKRLILLAGRRFQIPFAAVLGKRRTVRDTIARLARAGSSGDLLHDMAEHRTRKILRLIKDIPKDGGSRLDLPKSRQLACHERCNGFKDIYGRMAWDDVAPTITGGCFNPSKGRFLHPKENRAITMREAALLQSFPKTYWFPLSASKQAIALMIGNALPPKFIRRHAFEIARALKNRIAITTK